MILLNVIGINFEFHTLSKQIPVIIKKKKQFRVINQSGKTVIGDTDKLE